MSLVHLSGFPLPLFFFLNVTFTEPQWPSWDLNLLSMSPGQIGNAIRSHEQTQSQRSLKERV